ncbi:NAD(P)H:quinone oxidoreductase [Alteraurantiacibacter aquimixticola]|uniref:NAD(P)H:quinone oxidoreductase n=1 Tax=Alteraurantiacibacter aquimixticola TaxID=2489173 RepID=A0A4T3F4M4_9SPHN|nr:NAD(P)H:quinone oxidoreductase [Alteraurantiacibacter aquimixticola]TIX51741.1 NAD(P)H:quinone oxidoreductase [Alteraurantiacibacter aquimixticola]
MARILVLYYSSYGHNSQMAEAVAEGIREAGQEADIRRVPETAPEEIVKNFGFAVNEDHAVIESPDAVGGYDGVVLGAPTRFGRMPSQMASFLDTCGGLWASGAMIGKVGAAFSSSNSQHGGTVPTLFDLITNMLHFGMTIVGLDYGFDGQNGVDEVKGGSPYGATTIAGPDGSRQPSKDELDGAKYLGKRVANTAAKLSA